MYNISPYSYKSAERLELNIKPSKYKNKKIDVYDRNHKYLCSIGDSRYKDYPTYYSMYGKEYAEKRRDLYFIRHKNDMNVYGTPGFFSAHILW